MTYQNTPPVVPRVRIPPAPPSEKELAYNLAYNAYNSRRLLPGVAEALADRLREYGLRGARAGDFYSLGGPCTILAYTVEGKSEINVDLLSNEFANVRLSLSEVQRLMEALWLRPATSELVFLLAQQMAAGLADDDMLDTIDGAQPIRKAVVA